MMNAKLENYSISGLDLSAGLQHAGNTPATYLNFLQNFYESRKHYRSGLQSALMEADNVRLNQQVHGLRGVAATLGAFELDQSCAALLKEAATNAGHVPPILVANIIHALDKLLSGIENSAILDQVWDSPAKNPIAGLLQEFKLVLIEDDPILREMLVGELQKYFGEVVWFGLQQSALEYLQLQESYGRSIIVIDINLPDGSGLDIARMISQSQPGMVTLLVSGEEIESSELVDIKSSIQLLKPFSIHDLLNFSKGLALNLISQEKFQA